MTSPRVLATLEPQAARFLLDVAEALGKLSGNVSYGEFYVSEAVISFDGEEHGGYDIALVTTERSA